MSKFDHGGRSAEQHPSVLEEHFIEGLAKTLHAPWTMQREAGSVAYSDADHERRYRPDVLLTNEVTGRTVAVEFKSNLSLSMSNLIRFKQIQSAYEEAGTEFLLVVHNNSNAPTSKSQLAEYGIKAIDVRDPAQAAYEIEKHLPNI
ncbi:hypothetical protein [Massilia brevitalea]|uniref:hypothetical protein n=1 Tax=Massilia brevitalea TaxID=442526 RepID=UPI0027385E33|nr:hypothetical protein [Massilia brevitalea]